MRMAVAAGQQDVRSTGRGKRRLKLFLVAAGLAGLMQGGPVWGQQSASNKAAVDIIDYPQDSGKVQPLEWNGVPKWATLDLQLRGRTESQTSYNFQSGNEELYELTRAWGGLEVRPAKWLTGYIQFIDTHALGLPLDQVAANMRDVFDDRQAFLEFHAKHVKVIAGRQELRYGGERVVGISNWTNNSRTWDGFLGRIGDKNRLDVFSTSVVAVHPSSLDTHGAGLTFHGAAGTITTWVPHTLLIPFVFVRAVPRVQGQQGAYGTETEVTTGAEVSATYFGRFYFDVLGDLQRGSYANNSIRAGAGYVKAGYTSEKLAWKPRLLGEYDYASGNPHNDPQRMGTYDQQYPSNHNAFGLTDLFGFQNIKQERINLNVTPVKRLSLLFQQEWLQVAATRDSVYNGAAGVLVKAPAAGFSSGDIGREFDASGSYALLHDYLALAMGVGHFSPGTLMRGNAHGPPLTLAYLELTYRFKVNRRDGAP